jgi:hypothetical protein
MMSIENSFGNQNRSYRENHTLVKQEFSETLSLSIWGDLYFAYHQCSSANWGRVQNALCSVHKSSNFPNFFCFTVYNRWIFDQLSTYFWDKNESWRQLGAFACRLHLTQATSQWFVVVLVLFLCSRSYTLFHWPSHLTSGPMISRMPLGVW